MAGTIVDMHCHTTNGASDSALTPADLIIVAHRIGLTGVNVSEHDRVWDRYTLAKFREQKLIAVKGKALTVLSPARLTAVLRRNLGE